MDRTHLCWFTVRGSPLRMHCTAPCRGGRFTSSVLFRSIFRLFKFFRVTKKIAGDAKGSVSPDDLPLSLDRSQQRTLRGIHDALWSALGAKSKSTPSTLCSYQLEDIICREIVSTSETPGAGLERVQQDAGTWSRGLLAPVAMESASGQAAEGVEVMVAFLQREASYAWLTTGSLPLKKNSDATCQWIQRYTYSLAIFLVVDDDVL